MTVASKSYSFQKGDLENCQVNHSLKDFFPKFADETNHIVWKTFLTLCFTYSLADRADKS